MKAELDTRNRTHTFHFKDPGSAITHLIAVIMAVFATPPLLIRAFSQHNTVYAISMILFMLGVIALYTASTVYHSLDISESVNTKLRKVDHMMIYLLIAGSYSPICLIALANRFGYILFGVIWSLAFLGIFQALFFIHCPKWVSSTIYIVMGWMCLFAFPQILSSLSTAAFLWLLAGGIIYTVGGVIYALKLPIFNNRHKNFGSHEIFHLFCIGGTLCHYILMYFYIVNMK
ncbi:MAG: hemolysin III family protein [Lachnospiraceae bacterium]|nr:hemolysin III family protein [Lachnospiraceae bacterium]